MVWRRCPTRTDRAGDHRTPPAHGHVQGDHWDAHHHEPIQLTPQLLGRQQRVGEHQRERELHPGEPAAVERELSALAGATRVERRGEQNGFTQFVVLAKPGTELWREVSGLARTKNWFLRELHDQPLSLEETFLTLTEGASEVIGKGGAA